MYAERVISLACVYCSAHNRSQITEVDFRLLCWELYSCLNESPFGPEEVAQLELRLQNAKPDSPIRTLDPQLAPFLLGAAFKSRTISEQCLGRYWDRSSLVTSYLVAREFRELGLRGKTYEALERRFFLTSLEEFYRALWVIYVKANEGATVEFSEPSGRVQQREFGFVVLKESLVEAESAALDPLGLADGALRAAASRLSTPINHCGTFRAELDATDPRWRRYAPHVDLLSKHPILELESGGPCEHLLVPSPWRLVLAFNERVFFGFPEFLMQHNGLGEPAWSVRGAAFANYLDKAMKKVPGMCNVDALAGLGKDGKRPDFLWVGDDYGVLVEAKFSFRPNFDRALKDVSAAVTSWERAAEPLQQAREFLSVGLLQVDAQLRMSRRWVLAIVTTEPFVEDALGFKSIVRAGDLLADTGLEAITLLSPGELEAWAFNSSADDFARRAVEVFEALNPASMDQYPELGFPHVTKLRSPPHILDAWTELFGRSPEEDD